MTYLHQRKVQGNLKIVLKTENKRARGTLDEEEVNVPPGPEGSEEEWSSKRGETEGEEEHPRE